MGNVPKSQRISGAMLFAGAVGFAFALFMSESIYPGYSRSANYISDLGVGPAAALFNSSLFVVGMAAIASAITFSLATKQRLLPALLIICGIGAIGVGIFPEGSPNGLHYIMSATTFIFGALSAIASYKSGVGGIWARRLFALLGMLSIAALVLFYTRTYLGLGVGGMERMILYPFLFWAAIFGARAMRAGNTQ